jgi:hypothetical protein
MSIETVFFEELEKAIDIKYREYISPWLLLEDFISRNLKDGDQYYEDYIDLKYELKHKTKKTKDEFTRRYCKELIYGNKPCFK